MPHPPSMISSTMRNTPSMLSSKHLRSTFFLQNRAAISHVPALVPTICFDHSLIVFMTLRQQHSPSISQCCALNRRFLLDMTEWCMPALRALHHRIGLQSTNTHSAHSSLLPSGKRYRSLRTITSRHKKSWVTPILAIHPLLQIRTYLSFQFIFHLHFIYMPHYFIISCHMYLANHIFNITLHFTSHSMCVNIMSYLYIVVSNIQFVSIDYYLSIKVHSYVCICWIYCIEAQHATSHGSLGYVNILGI